MFRVVFIFLLLKEHCALLNNAVNRSIDMNTGLEPINIGGRPRYFDWRESHAVSPVKDQLKCGACWAFSTIAAIESQLKIRLSQEIVLSEQFLIDCDDGNAGCGYASLLQTFANIVTKFGGVLQYSDYSVYEGKQRKCRWAPKQKPSSLQLLDHLRTPYPAIPVPVVGFKRVRSDEEFMADFIYHYGPVTAAVNSASMAKYMKGTIDEPTDDECDPHHLDHAVLIVGFSVYDRRGSNIPYWIIKNSWGLNWGSDGFYYLVRGRNACGIASDVSFPFVE